MSEQLTDRLEVGPSTPVSLGHTTLGANNLTGTPVITGNYVSPQYELPLPSPDGDWYLRQTFVPAARAGEIVVCNTLIPGLAGHYNDIGLLTDEATLIEVEPAADGNSRYGFPYSDPLEQLDAGFVADGVNYLCSTFNGEAVTRQAERLGLHTIERSPSALTNNNALLRQAAEEYGYVQMPGVTIAHDGELGDAIDSEWNTDNGTWLKLATGSGGDLVQHMPGRLNEEKFYQAVQQLHQAVDRAFQAGQFNASSNDYWPNDSLAPGGFPLVIEADASILGSGATNGSTQFVTNIDGSMKIVGHFSQTTTADGEYLGNEPFERLPFEIQHLAEEQARLVARYNAREHGYFGIAAIDWFMVDDPAFGPRLVVGELNARPTANTPTVIIADKLGARHFVNINIYNDRPIETIDDFVGVVGKDLAFGSAHNEGMIVPQAFRTHVRREQTIASPNFKAALLGSNQEHCRELVARLSLRGIRFQP